MRCDRDERAITANVKNEKTALTQITHFFSRLIFSLLYLSNVIKIDTVSAVIVVIEFEREPVSSAYYTVSLEKLRLLSCVPSAKPSLTAKNDAVSACFTILSVSHFRPRSFYFSYCYFFFFLFYRSSSGNVHSDCIYLNVTRSQCSNAPRRNGSSVAFKTNSMSIANYLLLFYNDHV